MKALTVLRCKRRLQKTVWLPVMEAAMRKPKSKLEKLEVRVVFEANRLAAEHVIEAYRHLVPLRFRSAKAASLGERAELSAGQERKL